MSVFGKVPIEPPRQFRLDGLAPLFADALSLVLAEMPDAMCYETVRTNERQAFLFGFGRDYDDGRGVVTHAHDAMHGWHGFNLAADVIHKTKRWDAGEAWFLHLGTVAERHGLDWGGRWRMRDLPHLNWGKCKPAPSDEARRLYAVGGLHAVWSAVHANREG